VTKPTARQVWQQLLDEAGEDSIASVLAMTPEQVEAELAGLGTGAGEERAKADQFLEDLASGALETGSPARALRPLEQQPPPKLSERRRRPRTALVLLAAATTAAAAGGLAYSLLHQAPAPPQPSPQPPPTPAPSVTESPVVPDLVAAADWRKKAVAACNGAQWADCLADLDRARALDPAGDDAPFVKSTREKALRGLSGKANP
jgi:hypothetical protein